MNGPRISVCTPVYNLEQYVAETLESLKTQTFQDFEVLIIDDGSTDGSAKVIEPFLSDERFKYIYQENQGVGRARNHALEIAEGEWFAQLDGDDIYMPNALEVFASLSKTNKNNNFVYANMVIFSEDGTEQTAFAESDFKQGDLTDWIYQKYGFSTQHCMIRTQTMRDIGGYEEHFPALEDYDLMLRLALNRLYGASANEIVAKYRVRAHSKTSNVVRNAHLAVEMLENIETQETDKNKKQIIQKALHNRRAALLLIQAVSAANKNDMRFVEHLNNYVEHAPNNRRAKLISTLMNIPLLSKNKRVIDFARHKVATGLSGLAWTTIEDHDDEGECVNDVGQR